MRNLCTIQTVKKLEPIEGKDKIVLASFESVGWHVIVGIDTKVGDKVVYCETDTILPEKPEFEFLRKRCWNDTWKGFRIKRMKLGQTISEGLAIPLKDIYPDKLKDPWLEGKDITDLIGARKYDPEALLEAALVSSGAKKYNWVLRLLFHIPAFKQWYFQKRSKSWPSFVSKTDETRVQNLQYVFNPEWKGLPVYVTEKVDGQSATFALKDGVFYVCSRNLCITKERIRSMKRYPMQQTNYLKTAEKYGIADILKRYRKATGHDIYIQGEQCGPGIQGNKYGLSELTLFVFNVYDLTEKRYFSSFEVKNFCIEYGLLCVPRVYEGKFTWENIDEIVEFSKGNSLLHDIPREGVVIRSSKSLPPERGMANQFSMKVINPDFLVKYGLE